MVERKRYPQQNPNKVGGFAHLNHSLQLTKHFMIDAVLQLFLSELLITPTEDNLG